MARLLADPLAATRMGAKGRELVRAYRSHERLADALEARYLEM